jgi:NADPH-dependent curcumin reductase CurA
MHDAGDRNHRILFTFRPGELPVPEDFVADTTAVPTPGPGQFLARTVYLSLDPLQELLPGQEWLGTGVMAGDTVAQILESRHPEYRPGEYVLVRNGWQQFALSSGQNVRRLDPTAAPVSTALGVLGMAGLKGYVSLVYLGEPRPGQTVLVTGAAGPVGATAGQVARLTGTHVVGIEDSSEKCEYAVRVLKFAACLDRTSSDFSARLKRACPDGVDVYIDESDGQLLSAVELRRDARAILCGIGEGYLANRLAAGPVLRSLIAARATLKTLVVQDHLHRWSELNRVVGGWIRASSFNYREELTEGLQNAPEALCRCLRAGTFGKALVRVAPEHL